MRYSLLPEEAAEGLVLSVFGDVRARMPFVPAIFRALAADPPALARAWLQARALYDDPRSAGAASRLAQAARPGLAYRPSAAVREAVAPFAADLPRLLLIVTSLGLSLDGALGPVEPPAANLPDPRPLPETPVPELREEHPLYEDVRRAYGTEHVPSMYKALAAHGLLSEPWAAIGPFLGTPEGEALVARVESEADREARAFPDVAFFASESARPVLAQFRAALPRNLVFATAAAG